MRWAGDERRLGQACQAVLEFMQRHPIATTWGRSDLASSDMMSMETTKRVWQARLDPRRNTPSIGIYSHVRDRWGIFYAQPFVLNERQAGVAIEGVVRQERIETSQLAVDTQLPTLRWRWPEALVRSAPRLKELEADTSMCRVAEVRPRSRRCMATVDPSLVVSHWDALVHLAASVMSGRQRSGCAQLSRRGDLIYEAGAARQVARRFLRTTSSTPPSARTAACQLRRGGQR